MRRESLLLAEITAAASRAIEIAHQHPRESLSKHPDARDALLWNLTVVGEAVRQLPEDLIRENPHIPWAQPVRMRNRIVHGYWSIDLELLHEVASGDLPGFLRSVLAISASED